MPTNHVIDLTSDDFARSQLPGAAAIHLWQGIDVQIQPDGSISVAQLFSPDSAKHEKTNKIGPLEAEDTVTFAVKGSHTAEFKYNVSDLPRNPEALKVVLGRLAIEASHGEQVDQVQRLSKAVEGGELSLETLAGIPNINAYFKKQDAEAKFAAAAQESLEQGQGTTPSPTIKLLHNTLAPRETGATEGVPMEDGLLIRQPLMVQDPATRSLQSSGIAVNQAKLRYPPVDSITFEVDMGDSVKPLTYQGSDLPADRKEFQQVVTTLAKQAFSSHRESKELSREQVKMLSAAAHYLPDDMESLTHMAENGRLGEGLDSDLQKRIDVVKAREAAAGVTQGMQGVVTGGQTSEEGVRCSTGIPQETEPSCARR